MSQNKASQLESPGVFPKGGDSQCSNNGGFVNEDILSFLVPTKTTNKQILEDVQEPTTLNNPGPHIILIFVCCQTCFGSPQLLT